MLKKIFTICGFILIFLAAAATIFYMQKKLSAPAESPVVSNIQKQNEALDMVHTYSAENLQAGCTAEDEIFCAIERTVKCTINPELEDCNKNVVPAFVIGKAEDTERPTEISFKITKIKPIPESNDISVYTQSDCNALWFGLCKGTVVYSMQPKNNGWAVTNIFALE